MCQTRSTTADAELAGVEAHGISRGAFLVRGALAADAVFVLAIALIVLGPKRPPNAGRSLGEGIRSFRRSPERRRRLRRPSRPRGDGGRPGARGLLNALVAAPTAAARRCSPCGGRSTLRQ